MRVQSGEMGESSRAWIGHRDDASQLWVVLAEAGIDLFVADSPR